MQIVGVPGRAAFLPLGLGAVVLRKKTLKEKHLVRCLDSLRHSLFNIL